VGLFGENHVNAGLTPVSVPGPAVVADDLGKSKGRSDIRFRSLPPLATIPAAQSLLNGRESADNQT